MDYSLYIHIPFCRKKCSYCDFFSVPATKDETRKNIIDLILKELHIRQEQFGIESFKTIFIGGGTPNILSLQQMEHLLSAIPRKEQSVEISVELNPELISAEYLDLLHRYSVNRISIGVQSFRENVLSWLGRGTDRKHTLKGLAIAEEHWPGAKSIDLISALPDELCHSSMDDVRDALEYSIQHLSVYHLSLEEGTPLFDRYAGQFQGMEPSYDDSSITGYLEGKGFHRYEISNYAVNGAECLHNLRYWDLRPYLGIGPGAVSTIGSGSGSIKRIQNPRSLNKYIEYSGDSFRGIEEHITPREFLFDFCMMGLRKTKGISREIFNNTFGADPHRLFPDTISKWTRNGYLQYDKNILLLTGKGLDFSNRFLMDLLSETENSDKADELTLGWP